LALLSYIILIFANGLSPVTLTLAGIAGFILSIGMAVDANILIFERLKEEIRAGKEIHKAVEDGFARAWLSIRDSNVSSLITTVILYMFGTPSIKGFAVTLGVGILISMFTAITVTKTFLRIFVGNNILTHPWLFGVSRGKNAELNAEARGNLTT
jgi:preprotein translocase subunit SecD